MNFTVLFLAHLCYSLMYFFLRKTSNNLEDFEFKVQRLTSSKFASSLQEEIAENDLLLNLQKFSMVVYAVESTLL